MQAFTDLVGNSAVPALSINIDELTELTPTLDIATAGIHGKVEEASAAATTYTATFPFCYGCVG
jgi:hypothetical protein